MASTQEFGESFLKFMNTMNASAPEKAAYFPERLGAHFGTTAATLPIVTHKFPTHEHPNLQRALDELAAGEKESGRPIELLGFTTDNKSYQVFDLATLVADTGREYRTASPGPVEYKSIDIAEERSLSCVQSGLYLARPEGVPVAALVTGPSRFSSDELSVEVMAPTRQDAERFLARLRSRAHALSVYRGHVLSVDSDNRRGMLVRFHKLPEVTREGIILPEATLGAIERQTIRFSSHADELRRAGRHLKRGILLHGPPGTGKTLTAMYLASRMEGRTVLLATGRKHGLLEHTCFIARALQPSTVVLEDVDLFAQNREETEGASCATPLLFELLNQMDGLAEDADILFVLTTNRPGALEPALAARPGRIDQAIEVPLPDAECRRRLVSLYSAGIQLRTSDPERIIARTEGASAAFIRELLRRATLLACLDGRGPVVEDRHVEEAMREILIAGGPLTQRILGFGSGGAAAGASAE